MGEEGNYYDVAETILFSLVSFVVVHRLVVLYIIAAHSSASTAYYSRFGFSGARPVRSPLAVLRAARGAAARHGAPSTRCITLLPT